MAAAPNSREIKVNVRNIAVGGAGVGEVVEQAGDDDSLLGITAFVPFTAVGEVISARVVQQKKRHVVAELIEVEQSAPERVPPPCSYYQTCGGCNLQHISYEAQLAGKFEMIRGSLRAAKLPARVVDTLEAVEPSDPLAYRRRIALHVGSTGRVGFYRENSRSIVPIESCSVATPGINEVLARIQELGRKLAGTITSILLEEDSSGIVAVLQSPYALSVDVARKSIEQAKAFISNVTLVAGGKEVAGHGRQILELPLNKQGTCVLRVPAGHFSQVNWPINLKLIQAVVESANIQFGTRVYDFYAGAGNFALPLARVGAEVTAVESDTRLVSFGRENAHRNNVMRKLQYVNNSVERFLKFTGKELKTDVVVADPPRSGLGSLVREMRFSGSFLLVSCHLPSFVRDVKALIEDGWEVESIRPFDMFAQTSYVETLAVLRKG